MKNMKHERRLVNGTLVTGTLVDGTLPKSTRKIAHRTARGRRVILARCILTRPSSAAGSAGSAGSCHAKQNRKHRVRSVLGQVRKGDAIDANKGMADAALVGEIVLRERGDPSPRGLLYVQLVASTMTLAALPAASAVLDLTVCREHKKKKLGRRRNGK